MKLLEVHRVLPIPQDVTVEVKGRAVRVKGPRGTLQREWLSLCFVVCWKGQAAVHAWPLFAWAQSLLCACVSLSARLPTHTCTHAHMVCHQHSSLL